MKKFQTFWFLLIPFVTHGMDILEKYDSYIGISYHTSYPYCVESLIEKLIEYGATCEVGCSQIIVQNPSYLETFIQVHSPYLSSQSKEKMLESICKTECLACLEAMEKGLEL